MRMNGKISSRWRGERRRAVIGACATMLIVLCVVATRTQWVWRGRGAHVDPRMFQLAMLFSASEFGARTENVISAEA